MSQNYPELPKSPVFEPKKSAVTPAVPSPAPPSVTRKPPPSPLSKASELKNESKHSLAEAEEEKIDDFDKYEVKRAAIGTGIFSSLFTLSTVNIYL